MTVSRFGSSPRPETAFADLFDRHVVDPKRLRQAEERNETAIKRLRRSGWPEAENLASILEACSVKRPCRSQSCELCGGTIIWRSLRKAVFRFLRGRAQHETVVRLSLILPSGVAKPGELSQFSEANLHRRLKYLFDKVGLGWVIGCLDYSMNLHEADRYLRHWCVHFYGFTACDDPKALQARLRELLGKSDVVAKPIKIRCWDGSPKATRYMLKKRFWRRLGVDDAKRFDKKTGNPRKCRATKRRPMLASEKVELALHLHRIGWQSRLLSRHVQLRRSPKGPIIVPIDNHG